MSHFQIEHLKIFINNFTCYYLSRAKFEINFLTIRMSLLLLLLLLSRFSHVQLCATP